MTRAGRPVKPGIKVFSCGGLGLQCRAPAQGEMSTLPCSRCRRSHRLRRTCPSMGGGTAPSGKMLFTGISHGSPQMPAPPCHTQLGALRRNCTHRAWLTGRRYASAAPFASQVGPNLRASAPTELANRPCKQALQAGLANRPCEKALQTDQESHWGSPVGRPKLRCISPTRRRWKPLPLPAPNWLSGLATRCQTVAPRQGIRDLAGQPRGNRPLAPLGHSASDECRYKKAP